MKNDKTKAAIAEALLVGLNPEQKRAVKTIDGALLILAGAGSGKTKTLTHRVAYLLGLAKAPQQEIMAVTFTNKAAAEMRQRVARLLGQSAQSRTFMPFMATFHSVCARLLRHDGETMGIPRNFVIWDEGDRKAAIKKAMSLAHVDEKKFPSRLLAALISGAKSEMVTPSEYQAIASSPVEKTAAKIYPLYEKSLTDSGALDFDDLITRAVVMLKTKPAIAKKWQTHFKYILVDEYQDTNAAQYQLIKLLAGSRRNIAVVGDDWQSIYSWRGADYRNILNFEKDFPGCAVIKLEQNYRSSGNILAAAHNVITQNHSRSNKKLWTKAGDGEPVQILQASNERQEAEMIINRIKTAVDIKLRRWQDFAILYRTNAQSRILEEILIHHSVPYKIFGGTRFYDRQEIKDIVAYLRLLHNPSDAASFSRVVNVPSRSLGQKSLAVFNNWRSASHLDLSSALERVKDCPGLTPRASRGFENLAATLADLHRQADDLTPVELLDKLIKRIDYIDYLNDDTVQGEARAENVRELLSVAKQYQAAGLPAFLEEIALVSDLDEANTKSVGAASGAVTLMTLHSAKGLEFPAVFIVGLEETVLPHSKALYDQSEMEEERRLMYVGMTRAREELFLSYATERMLYGGRTSNPPSRFLADIDQLVVRPAGDYGGGLTAPDYVSQETRLILELDQGDRVHHANFGVGTILGVEDDVATVNFAKSGVKVMNLSFAPLKKLEDES